MRQGEQVNMHLQTGARHQRGRARGSEGVEGLLGQAVRPALGLVGASLRSHLRDRRSTRNPEERTKECFKPPCRCWAMGGRKLLRPAPGWEAVGLSSEEPSSVSSREYQ